MYLHILFISQKYVFATLLARYTSFSFVLLFRELYSVFIIEAGSVWHLAFVVLHVPDNSLFVKMALYPSLEDMKVDHMVQAQVSHMLQASQQQQAYPSALVEGGSNLGTMYPALTEYMGLELSQEMIALNMPEYSQMVPATNNGRPNVVGNMVAPLSGQSVALQKSFVTQGIRQIVLCKDDKGKIGLRLRAVSNGLFVCLVMKGSVAAMAGLRFGDQVLEINNKAAAGMSMDEAHKILKNAPVNGISLSIRDRPFERTLTLHKDSVGHIGFHFKDGEITGLVKDSSAARNGLLIDHQLVEVNGQNVVGLKDKEIAKIIGDGDTIVTVTIIPSPIYKHMIKKMATNLLKNSMDHTPAV